jgi:hypothetical protein
MEEKQPSGRSFPVSRPVLERIKEGKAASKRKQAHGRETRGEFHTVSCIGTYMMEIPYASRANPVSGCRVKLQTASGTEGG